MARKTLTVTVDTEGRDFGKVFVLREMPCSQAEAWGLRALSALAASGVAIPDDIAQAGMLGVARMGLTAFGGLPWNLAEPLLREMFECVSIQPDPTKAAVVRSLVEDDIEEIPTRIKLRAELFKLHMGFLWAVYQSTQASQAAPETIV